jgi:predicted dehydrogenase
MQDLKKEVDVKKIRFGVIGAGGIFLKGHSYGFGEIEEAELIMICRTNKTLAKKIARDFHVSYTTSYEKLLENSEIEAVLITTPHQSHLRIVLDAAQAGKDILCEKPLALNLKECDRIIRACKKAKVKLMVAENYIFDPVVQIIKRLIDEGKLGKIREMRFIQGWSGPLANSWRYKKEIAGGGVLFDDGVHLVSLARWFRGEVKKVVGLVKTERKKRDYKGKRIKVEVEDRGSLILEFKDGGIAIIETNWCLSPGIMSIEVFGDRGTTIYSSPGWSGGKLKILSREVGMENISGIFSAKVPQKFPSPESYINQLRYFCQCIIDNKEPIYDGEEGKRAVEIILAGYKSSAGGREVIIST